MEHNNYKIIRIAIKNKEYSLFRQIIKSPNVKEYLLSNDIDIDNKRNIYRAFNHFINL